MSAGTDSPRTVLLKVFGGRLRELRKDCKLTQNTVAEHAKVSFQTVSGKECGDGARAPKWDFVQRYVTACSELKPPEVRVAPERFDLKTWRTEHDALVRALEAVAVAASATGASSDDPDRQPRQQRLPVAPGRRSANHGADVVAESYQVLVADMAPDRLLDSDQELVEMDRMIDNTMVPAASTAIPREPGPLVVHGRDGDVERLLRCLEPRHRLQRPQILAGMSGVGKSTIARSVADKARSAGPRRRVWWISASNEERLSATLTGLARDLGASTADQARIRTHTVADLGDVADRVWQLIDDVPRGWLLIIDNADNPRLLGPPDGTGWIRPTAHGLLLVTTCDGDEASWPEADIVRVDQLPPDAAARVLLDLAPGAGNSDRTIALSQATDLAKRLGCLPMALRIAGMQLRQDFPSWRTFDEYRRALDDVGIAQVLNESGASAGRTAVSATWELSLDALARSGVPQARPLLWLLSCYAPGHPIPHEIITVGGSLSQSSGRPEGMPHPLASLLDPDHAMPVARLAEYCRAGLRKLKSVGLIEHADPGDGPEAVELHPLIAEVTRTIMDADPALPAGPSTVVVRANAASAICTTLLGLDTGSADHWPYFRSLTPHVHELLASTAQHLSPAQRRDLLSAMVRCIVSYVYSRSEQRAEQLADDALALGDQLGCRDSAVYLRLLHVRAWSIRERGRLPEAEEAFRRVLAAQLALKDGAERVDTLRTRHQLAWTVGRQGEWAKAEEELREVLRLRRDRLHRNGGSRDDADILHTRCMLYWCVGKQGRWGEAEQEYRQLIIDRQETLGPDHPDTLDARHSMAKTLAWQGARWTAAETEWRRAAADRERALGARHPDTLLSHQLEYYACGYRAWQNSDREALHAAIARLEEVLRVQRDVRGDHRDTLETRALLTALAGDYSAGMPWPEDLPKPGTDRPGPLPAGSASQPAIVDAP